MAMQITNMASATYGYGREGRDSATSNVAVTNLIEDYAISGLKTALKTTFRVGENIAYQIYIQNDGTQPLYNVTVVDDLGGSRLLYILESAYLNLNGFNSVITPTNFNPLTFVLPSPLEAGGRATITYMAKVLNVTGEDDESITNTVQITASRDSQGSSIISVTPSPTETINPEDYANLLITKDVSSSEVVPGQPFSYTITLENSGNLDATGVVITDVLPTGFSISSIVSTTGGIQTIFTEDDYVVDPVTNTLTLPSGSIYSISVPASQSGVPGKTVVTITGIIA